MKEKLKISLRQLREEQYAHNNKINFPEMYEPIKSPYSWLKARFYMESSAILVYLLLKTDIHPNTITIIYALSAMLGGGLIASGYTLLVIVGVSIFFTRGILDWSDGHLARKTGRTSQTGHVLDVYGAILGSVSLGVGLGLFVASRTDSILVYYLIPLYPIFRVLLLTNYAQSILFRKMLDTDYSDYKIAKVSDTLISKRVDIRSSSTFSAIYNLIYSFLDDRARTVDFVGFIILVDLYFDTNYTFYLFLLITIKWFIAYVGSFYVVAYRGWIEPEYDKVISSVSKYKIDV